MSEKLFSKSALIAIFFLASSLSSFSQVTTATLGGTVKNEKGEPLPGATVKIELPDAGINYTLITKGDGRFTVPNLRVGGPYKVTVSFVNYQPSVTNELFLELGQHNTLNLVLSEKSTEFTAVVVTGQSRIFDNKRTGLLPISATV